MIVGITGKARSGKDTFASVLAESLYNTTGRKFVLMAYAHELKLRIQKDFDLSYEQLWGDEKEVEDHRYIKEKLSNGTAIFWTPREILQAYGQFFRSIDNEFWIRSLFDTIDSKDYVDVIVTDVRHPNEAKAIVDRLGCIIRVERSDGTYDIHGKQHISETAMDSYKADFVVVNESTVMDLKSVGDDVSKFLFNYEKQKKLMED